MNERNLKLVASCRSLYEAKLFLKKCDDLGYHWKDGTKFSGNEYWHLYKECTCYNIFEGTFGDIENYIEKGYDIVDCKKFFKKIFLQQFAADKLQKFEEVLVRKSPTSKWQYGIFEKCDPNNPKYPFMTLVPHHQTWAECIPFDGNENLFDFSV